MALTKKTASHHNLKRAEVFKAHGINDWDVKFAHPHFLGADCSPEGGTCSLCGQQHLKWLYSITFTAPDLPTSLGAITKGIARTEEVTFNPVGSVCINDWFDALPESVEKLEALKRWKIEMEKEKAAKKVQAIENAMKKHGLVDLPSTLGRLRSIPLSIKSQLSWYERRVLSDFTHRLSLAHLSFVKKFRSPKAVELLAKVLVQAETLAEKAADAAIAAKAKGPIMVVIDKIEGDEDDADYGQHGDPEDGHAHARNPDEDDESFAADVELDEEGHPLPPLAEDMPVESPKPIPGTLPGQLFPPSPEAAEKAKKEAAAKAEVEALLERGREVYRDKTKLANLDKFEQNALADIGKKVKHYGSFYSDSQKNFFVKLITKGEKGSAPSKPVAEGAEGAEEEPVAAAAPGAEGFVSASKIPGARY